MFFSLKLIPLFLEWGCQNKVAVLLSTAKGRGEIFPPHLKKS